MNISLKWVTSTVILKLVQLSFRDSFPWDIPQFLPTNNRYDTEGAKNYDPEVKEEFCTKHAPGLFRNLKKDKFQNREPSLKGKMLLQCCISSLISGIE